MHGPGSDIDTLCIVPKRVTREDFFDVLEGIRNTGVTEDFDGHTSVILFLILPAHGIPNAHIPTIKLKISGIPIDLLMARPILPSILDDLALQKIIYSAFWRTSASASGV